MQMSQILEGDKKRITVIKNGSYLKISPLKLLYKQLKDVVLQGFQLARQLR